MFGFVRGVRVRGRAVVVVLVVAGLLGGVTASSVAAATKTTVTWKVSSLTAGQEKNLSAVASTNSKGVKTWSKTGSCTLSPKSKPTKLTMGTGVSCTLTLKIAKSGKYPAKTSTKKITRKSSTTTTTTTLAPALYSVGQAGPGGGTIFYVDMARAAGSQYFEAACAGWQNNCDGTTVDPLAGWGCYGTEIAGADGTAIGAGGQNTADIVAGCGTAGTAARLADNYSYNGLDDWFLPSKDELNALCKWAYSDTANAVCNDDGSGSLSLTYGGVSDYAYWSSSESADVNAWDQNPASGEQYHHDKGYPYCVRPVRAF